jgi:hypothetical protein
MRLLVSSHESSQSDVSAPANDATRDPLLRHKIHCAEIMDAREALDFAVFTHKSPRAVEYMRADGAFDNLPSMQHVAKVTVSGRPLVSRNTHHRAGSCNLDVIKYLIAWPAVYYCNFTLLIDPII